MTPPELVLVFAWSFLVSFAGGMVGLVLGNVRLPVVVWVGSSVAAASGANVAISGTAAVTAALVHWRNGRLDRQLLLWMAPSSFLGAVAGGLLSGLLPERLLLAVIAVAVLYGAAEVWRRRRADPPSGQSAFDRNGLLLEAVLIGFGIGLLGGLVGLILGSLRLPAMLKYMGIPPGRAVGTNSAVGVAVGIGGLIGHLPGGIDWAIFATGAAAAVPAAWLGARFTGRLSDRALLTALAAVLAATGLVLAVQTFA